MNLKFKNEGTKALIIESFLIIFSVMLGLLANDFRASINQKETARVAWENISRELKLNGKEIGHSVERQKALSVELTKLIEKKDYFIKSGKSFYDVLHSAGGVNFPEISTVAWETAKDRGTIENFSYNRLLLLTNISEKTKAIKSIDEKILNVIYNKDMFNIRYAKDLANTIRITLADLIRSEKDLLSIYEKIQHNS